jgi:predicted nucleotidyltransferase
VDLGDGEGPLQVEVDFLAPRELKLKKNHPKLLEGFRVLKTESCGAAFHAPEEIELSGQTVCGARNKVRLWVASLPDFLVMKAHALAGRDKPKDGYDIFYCLDNYPSGLEELAAAWKDRSEDRDVKRAIEILREKFSTVEDFGPKQVVEFFDSSDAETQAIQARRAFELVQKLLRLLQDV